MSQLLKANVFCSIKHFAGKVNVYAERYDNGRLALQLKTADEPVATCTANLPYEDCPSDEIFVKDYSENEGMVSWMIEAGIIEPRETARARSGYVMVARYRLTEEWRARLEARKPK